MSLVVGAALFVGVMLVLAFLPTIFGWVLDPINARRIRAYCESAGCAIIEIQPFPNHYGVAFEKNGKKGYAKCRVSRGVIKWKGKAPEEL
jgi:hypothetical protein